MSSNHNRDPKWLQWSRQLMAIAQNGLTFVNNPFDKERYAFTLDPIGESTTAFRIASGPDPQSIGEETVFEMDREGHTATAFTITGVGKSIRIR